MRSATLGFVAATLIVALLASALPAAAAGSIAVAPAEVELAQALRGSEYLRTITIVNLDDGPVTYTVTTAGDAAAWLTIAGSAGVELVLPGGGQVQLELRAAIPAGAGYGSHIAVIHVRSLPLPQEEAAPGDDVVVRSPVSFEAAIPVRIAVTGTARLSGRVAGISAGERTEPGQPYRVAVQFGNTGNVPAHPHVGVEFQRAGQVVRSAGFADWEVPVGGTADLTLAADTGDLPPGDYSVAFAVSLGGSVVFRTEMPLAVVPAGTLLRQGELVSLAASGEPAVGRVLKLLVTFANTGQVETRARPICEVYRDGALVATVEGREALVLEGDEAVLVSYYKVEEPGDYVVRGRVSYGDRQTAVTEAAFALGEPAPVRPAPPSILADARALELGPVTLALDLETLLMAGIIATTLALFGLTLGLIGHGRRLRAEGHYREYSRHEDPAGH